MVLGEVGTGNVRHDHGPATPPAGTVATGGSPSAARCASIAGRSRSEITSAGVFVRVDGDDAERAAVQPDQDLRAARRGRDAVGQRAGQLDVAHGDRGAHRHRGRGGARPATVARSTFARRYARQARVAARSPRHPTGATRSVTSRVRASASRSRSTRMRESAKVSSPAWL